ncbi:MAG TPA: hypothetical protein VIF02_03325 [Methylocella sp.]
MSVGDDVIDRASKLESLTTLRVRGEVDDFEESRQALFGSLFRPTEPTILFFPFPVSMADNDQPSLVCPSANGTGGHGRLADVAFPLEERDDRDALCGSCACFFPNGGKRKIR